MTATTGPSPLLALPRETRDQIYRELLTPTIGTQERNSYGLDPAILRANRQVHREASEILYNESCWILFRTSCPDNGEPVQCSTYPPKPTVVLQRGESSFGGQFAMEIDITNRYEFPDIGSEDLTWILASVYDLQFTLSGLRRSIPPRRFKLAVGIQHPFQKHLQHQERMLECLRGVRGLERALVQVNQLPCLDKDIERQMMTPYKHREERTERLRMYQYRGDRQLALGKYLDAAIIYRDGFLNAWHHLYDFPELEPESSDWENQILVLNTASAFCSYKAGYIAQARFEISSILCESNVQDAQKATAFYVLGLIFLAEDSYTDASIVFHQALTLRPGYEAVIQEVDRMGARFGIFEEQDNTS